MLETYCNNIKICPSLFIHTLGKFHIFLNRCNIDFNIFKKYHIKLFCFLVDKYCKHENRSIESITNNELSVIFFLILIHVIDDVYDYNSDILGHNKTDFVLSINDIIFPIIFQINCNSELVTKYWKEIKSM